MCKFANDHQDKPVTPAPAPTDLNFIPINVICQKAYEHCAERLHPAILNHSIRVFLHAKHIVSLPASISGGAASPSADPHDAETLLFVAALFHDMGTVDSLNGPERFEVCGADAAVAFLQEHAPRLAEQDRHAVWTAIACHTSPGVAERIAPLARLLRLAVLVDFDRPGLRAELRAAALSGRLDERHPRMEIERVLGDAVVAQIMGKAEGRERLMKAPSNSWPGSLLRGFLEMRREGVEGVNRYF